METDVSKNTPSEISNVLTQKHAQGDRIGAPAEQTVLQDHDMISHTATAEHSFIYKLYIINFIYIYIFIYNVSFINE